MRDRDPFSGWPARPFGERSLIAVELGLVAYAAVATLVVARIVLLAGNVTEQLWIGAFVFQFTDPIVRGLEFLPGADRTIVGRVTLPDATLAAVIAALPLVALARGRPAQNV